MKSWFRGPKPEFYCAPRGAAEAAPFQSKMQTNFSASCETIRRPIIRNRLLPLGVRLLELHEFALQFPLLAGASVGGKELFARRGRLLCASRIAGTRWSYAKYQLGISPQTLTGEKTVLQALARHAF